MSGTGETAKTAAWNACRYLGVNRIAHWRMRRQLLVLCYHGVVAQPKRDRFRHATTVSVAEFEEHLDAIAKHFTPISGRELIAWYEGGAKLPDYPLLVTFDDGYRNNLTLAAPALLQRKIPCVFHVTTGYIGTPRLLWTDEVISRVMAWPLDIVPLPEGGEARLPEDGPERRRLASACKERCKRIPWSEARAYLTRLRQSGMGLLSNGEVFGFLNWDEVRELRRLGFEIGSHTVEHPILTQLPPEELQTELIESKRRIERETGAPCVSIAYPNGGGNDFSASVMEGAREAGYRLAFTIVEEFNRGPEQPMAVNRLCIMGHLPVSFFHFRVNGAARLLNRFGGKDRSLAVARER